MEFKIENEADGEPLLVELTPESPVQPERIKLKRKCVPLRPVPLEKPEQPMYSALEYNKLRSENVRLKSMLQRLKNEAERIQETMNNWADLFDELSSPSGDGEFDQFELLEDNDDSPMDSVMEILQGGSAIGSFYDSDSISETPSQDIKDEFNDDNLSTVDLSADSPPADFDFSESSSPALADMKKPFKFQGQDTLTTQNLVSSSIEASSSRSHSGHWEPKWPLSTEEQMMRLEESLRSENFRKYLLENLKRFFLVGDDMAPTLSVSKYISKIIDPQLQVRFTPFVVMSSKTTRLVNKKISLKETHPLFLNSMMMTIYKGFKASGRDLPVKYVQTMFGNIWSRSNEKVRRLEAKRKNAEIKARLGITDNRRKYV